MSEHQCQVCGADTEIEAILFPTEVSRLFAMMAAREGDTEGWPSAWLCEACAERSAPLFHLMAEYFPIAWLVEMDCETLVEILASPLLQEALRDRFG